jgi:hypothetical protein
MARRTAGPSAPGLAGANEQEFMISELVTLKFVGLLKPVHQSCDYSALHL